MGILGTLLVTALGYWLAGPRKRWRLEPEKAQTKQWVRRREQIVLMHPPSETLVSLAQQYEAALRHDRTGESLRGLELADKDFMGVNLAKAALQGADLSRANVCGANIAEANLLGANLNRSHSAVCQP